MRGVTFGISHSYWDWGLMLKKAPEISPPDPKTHYVDIPGAQGAMDLTEMLTGQVQYKNRAIRMEFVTVAGREEWSAIYSAILNDLHGQRKEITFDDDPMHYYTGRVIVGNPTRNGNIVTITMTAEVEPFKRTVDGTVVL